MAELAEISWSLHLRASRSASKFFNMVAWTGMLKINMEILPVEELATLLKMTKRQIYEMTNTRTRTGAMKEHPLPVLKINGNLRFRKSDVETWVEGLALRGK